MQERLCNLGGARDPRRRRVQLSNQIGYKAVRDASSESMSALVISGHLRCEKIHFTPESRHVQRTGACLLRAKSRHLRRKVERPLTRETGHRRLTSKSQSAQSSPPSMDWGS